MRIPHGNRRARCPKANAISAQFLLNQNSERRPGSHARATHLGAARHVRGVTFDRGTGEVLTDSATRPESDGEAIAAAAAPDGCHLIVTSETDWPDQRMLDAYRELWRIGESLRVTKTGGLGSRPARARAPEHIRAHLPARHLALAMVRLSQRALPSHPSAEALLEDMRALDCSYADDGWWLFDHRTDLTDEMFALVGLNGPTREALII